MSKKLKIGFVFDDSLDRTDGIQQYIKTVGRWLLAHGHDVKFLVGETKHGPFPDRTYSLSKNFKVTGNGNSLSIPLPASSKQIKEVLAAEKFDVLHVQAPYNPLLAGKVLKHADSSTKKVGTFHIDADQWFTKAGARVMGFLQNKSLRQFDSFVSVSKAAQRFAHNNYSVSTEILPNVIQFAKANTSANKSRHSLVFLGRLVERKGCRHLLEAVALLEKKYMLTICGDGPQRKSLEALVDGLGLRDRVTFLGRVSEEEKYNQLAKAELAVFPSLHGESFGIVLLEAMSVGTVTLGGDNPGYRTVLEDQAEHLLVDPTNTTELAARITTLVEDDSLHQKLLQWQHDHVRKFDIEVVGPKLVELYSS
ncbi:TPA: glycosyltransferase family 1 protein [Candidatus Saccharibacteria bacterium]|nr:glycosyltransferase family 1 protein [Candidatus Saccharibacteria bacterium]HIO87301.1 glycosyltransferase family 1 protein [Candidatus Saccharibacteria bacterium]